MDAYLDKKSIIASKLLISINLTFIDLQFFHTFCDKVFVRRADTALWNQQKRLFQTYLDYL